jgi:hypothetical protein
MIVACFRTKGFMNLPETNREEVIPAVATREVVSGMVAIKGQSALTTLKGNY